MDEFRIQLEQVRLALQKDPKNEELQKMETDLQKLIELTSNVEQKSAKVSKPSATSEKKENYIDWRVGEKCEAKNANNVYCPASIISMSADRTKFTVKFENGDSSIMSKKDIRRISPGSTSIIKEHAPKKKSGTLQTNQKKKKSKAEYLEEKEKEQAVKQASWQKFTNKAIKQGSVGIVKKSIFATSAPNKTLTEISKKSRHTFNPADSYEEE